MWAGDEKVYIKIVVSPPVSTTVTHIHVLVTLPLTVNVTTPVGAIIAGSSPNLTCTVVLSPAVDVPVTVNTMWTGPDLTTVTPTSPLMERLTRYVITAMIDAARNGSYTCRATVSSSSQFITGGGMMSGSTTITVGMCRTYCVYCSIDVIFDSNFRFSSISKADGPFIFPGYLHQPHLESATGS